MPCPSYAHIAIPTPIACWAACKQLVHVGARMLQMDCGSMVLQEPVCFASWVWHLTVMLVSDIVSVNYTGWQKIFFFFLLSVKIQYDSYNFDIVTFQYDNQISRETDFSCLWTVQIWWHWIWKSNKIKDHRNRRNGNTCLWKKHKQSSRNIPIFYNIPK